MLKFKDQEKCKKRGHELSDIHPIGLQKSNDDFLSIMTLWISVFDKFLLYILVSKTAHYSSWMVGYWNGNNKST